MGRGVARSARWLQQRDAMVAKQLSRTEQAMVAELKRELRIVGCDPAKREQTIAAITRIDPFHQTGAV